MLKYDFERIKVIARSYGARCIIASYPNIEDKLWPKFIGKFGFPEPQKVFISKMEI